VKIEIPRVLLHLRGKAVEGKRRGPGPSPSGLFSQEGWAMRALGLVFRHPRLYRWALTLARRLQSHQQDGEGWIRRLPGYASGWTRGRDLPGLPGRSFLEWWEEERGGGSRDEEARGDASKGGESRGDRSMGGESRGGEWLDPGKEEVGAPETDVAPDDCRRAGELGAPETDVAPADYRHTGELALPDRLDLFVERVSEYRATVTRCRQDELPAAIARRVREGGVGRMVVPEDVPEAWLAMVSNEDVSGARSGSVSAEPPGSRPVEVLRDGGAGGHRRSPGTLASAGAVLTGCALAIAETGTFVLDSGPRQGRRALTLLPDHHVCVVFSSQIVEIVPEAIRALAETVRDRQAPLTFVSGPSATSDIELERVEGVHGPRILDVILVEEGAD
jgi:L-lactate dehydrogenase complex protein LldG